MRDRCLRIGYDLARERVEVCPTAHFNMGGVRINRDGFTNLVGLFAAGEDSAGDHGAHRLGGNGVAESTVYGARVGDAVSDWVKTVDQPETQKDQVAQASADAEKFLNHQGESPWALRDALGEITWTKVGIVRTGPDLAKAIEEIAALNDRNEAVGVPGNREFNLTWQQCLDMRNMLL